MVIFKATFEPFPSFSSVQKAKLKSWNSDAEAMAYIQGTSWEETYKGLVVDHL